MPNRKVAALAVPSLVIFVSTPIFASWDSAEGNNAPYASASVVSEQRCPNIGAPLIVDARRFPRLAMNMAQNDSEAEPDTARVPGDSGADRGCRVVKLTERGSGDGTGGEDSRVVQVSPEPCSWEVADTSSGTWMASAIGILLDGEHFPDEIVSYAWGQPSEQTAMRAAIRGCKRKGGTFCDEKTDAKNYGCLVIGLSRPRVQTEDERYQTIIYVSHHATETKAREHASWLKDRGAHVEMTKCVPR